MSIQLSLGLAVFVYLATVWRRGFSDPLLVQMLFYIFFAFGPVINFLTGNPVYFGIKQSYIPTASMIFLVAVVAIALVAWIIPLRARDFQAHAQRSSPLERILKPANAVMLIVTVVFIGLLFFRGGGGSDKIRNISLIGTRLHYVYLLIQLYLTAFFFNAGMRGNDRILYLANFIFYVLYCVSIGERDFVFPLIGLLLHWSLMQPASKRGTFKLVLGGALLIMVGTAIFFLRDSSQVFQSPFVAVLNQGSLLFINTFTLHLLDGNVEHFYGQTYINSILNLFPSGLWGTDFNLLDWFKNLYAPTSTSGYGYGLDAEGYLNFGWAGVFVTFVLISLVQRLSFNAQRWTDFCLFFTVFSFSFTMYSYRNDSLAFLKGHLYAAVSYLALYFLSRFLPSREKL